MALLFFDGFDHYQEAGGFAARVPNLYTVGSSGSTLQLLAMPVLGGLGISATQSQNRSTLYYTPGFSMNDKKYGFGFHTYLRAPSGVFAGLHSNFASDIQQNAIWLGRSSAGFFYVQYWGSALNNLIFEEVTTYPMAVGVLHHIEFAFDKTAPYFEVRINGETVVQTTAAHPAANMNALRLHTYGAGIGSNSNVFDNLFFWDDTGSSNNDFLGERIVQTVLPRADTAKADWVLSTGTDGYQLINKVPPTAEYLEAVDAGDQSNFLFGSLGNPDVSISALAIVANAQKTASGPADLQIGLDFNSTEDSAPATAVVQDQYLYYHHVVEKNPDTGADWQPADLSTLEGILRRTT